MNRIKLLIIAFGFMFSMNLNAQNDFKIGVNAGINYPDFRGNEYANYHDFKVGYLFGLSFDYYLKENLSIKTNVNYETRIKKFKVTYYNYEAEETGTDTFRETYAYLNVPVLLKYEFGDSGFFANGGPFFNYFLNNKIERGYPNEERNGVTERKKVNFGVSVGMGTNIPLNGKNELSIEIRDDFGVIDTGGVPKHIDGTVKTNAVKFILGWNLGI